MRPWLNPAGRWLLLWACGHYSVDNGNLLKGEGGECCELSDLKKKKKTTPVKLGEDGPGASKREAISENRAVKDRGQNL